MAVGLADAAEVARDGLGPAEVDVRSVHALRIQGFHAGGAENFRGGAHGGKVSPVRFLLFHLPHADKPPGKQFALLDALPHLGEKPGEYCMALISRVAALEWS